MWEDQPCVLGGRDLVAGGTWLCLGMNSGRAAFLTNFRELRDTARLGAPSRGALPLNFVTSTDDAETFLFEVDSKAYPGFNLVAVDLPSKTMLYLCNKHDGQQGRVEAIPPGVHGITNGHMDARWPKVDEGCRRLQQLIDSGAFSADTSGSKGVSGAEGIGSGSGTSGLVGGTGGSGDASGTASGSGAGGGDGGSGRNSSSSSTSGSDASVPSGGSSGSGGCRASVPWGQLFGLLSDDRLLEQEPGKLPRTGYGDNFEARVSGIYVRPVDTRWGPFGTRSQIVVAVWADGRAELREKYLAADGSWQERQHCFQMPVGSSSGSGGGAGGDREAGESLGGVAGEGEQQTAAQPRGEQAA